MRGIGTKAKLTLPSAALIFVRSCMHARVDMQVRVTRVHTTGHARLD